jgi:formylglycine-generating enzyme required for sulfatase activity
MLSKKTHPVWIWAILLSGLLLTGPYCPAQADVCDPDPCLGITNATAGTCAEVGGGSCVPADDFTCACDPGSTWQDAANTCLGPVAQIPAGCFDMGDHFAEGDGDELPVHEVCISVFEMDVHEVTNAEYAACVADSGACTPPLHSYSISRGTYYGDPTYDDFPVILVDWYQAQDFCTWAGKRLPTEAEWEYAARGGLSGKRYPWGDTISGTDANYYDSGDSWDNDTSQVEYYAPNGYGLYDMAGNVGEWVNDWYQSGYYSVSPTNDPPGPAVGMYPVLRGGSWGSSTLYLRVAARSPSFHPAYETYDIGFRCAR